MSVLSKLGVAGVFVLFGACCPQTPPTCPRRVDDTAEDIPSTRVACQRAGARLAELKCPEARPDYVDFCIHTIETGIPICPVKISKIKSCAEVDSICR